MIRLKGITWNHTRGYDPMVATAAAYCAEHPDVEIIWEKRSLHDFGAAPVDQLAQRYDFVVLDHPWAGFIADTRCYLPLDEWLPHEVLQSLAQNSVGPSHRSYEYDGHQWALAIDAATLVASYRPDLLARLGEEIPRSWQEVVQLAKRCHDEGLSVAVPLGPVDAISAFLTLADNIGAELFVEGTRVINRDAGHFVLKALEELVAVCPQEVYEMTPVTMMEQMSTTDTIVYCPMAYGYNNYARSGYRRHLCKYANIPALGSEGPRGSHLGGTGLAVSARCQHPEVAADYAACVAGADWQRTKYLDAGGQPGHAAAWEDEHVNEVANNFFTDTRETIERAFLRPRYNGYIDFQYAAGAKLTGYLRDGGDAGQLLNELDQMYHQSWKQSLKRSSRSEA